ncbi:cyclase family protein [Shimia sp. R10_1]|uniref:cyclase family protein n=1 Tax=Shimia sp. R10_1 TaxID=2821095 RepID=UPI001ADC9F02|nr:cyclase family protein [Shimia sp. R10_1]MBO9473657.1 cyclase family protein [Shimia sp. R10_1]
MNKKRWTQRPEGSTWGDWGENDQLGRINLIGKEQIRQGAAEIRTGESFCLSLPLDYPGGNVLSAVRHPPVFQPVIRNNAPYYNYLWQEFDARHPDIASDDAVLLYTQYSTQWDSLAHRGSMFDVYGDGNQEPVYYNGFRAHTDVILNKKNHSTQAKKLGIEHMACHGVQGRGVLVDLHSHFGDFPRHEVNYDDLMRVLECDDIEIQSGDILCLWTGLDKLIMQAQGEPDASLKNACAVMDGHDPKLLKWITDSGIAAIVSDNLAIEAVGKTFADDYCGSTLPLHEHCLFKLGLPLGELWFLADLAQFLRDNNRSRFFLTAPPLRLTGAVGSPLTPIATV